MTSIRNSTTTILVSLLIFFGGFTLAAATEVTGTLSSDGEAGTQQGSVLSETNSNEATSQAVAQNGGQIQGSVTGGREETAAVAFADPSSWSTAAWVVPLAVAILAAFAYLFWRRESV